MFCFYNAKKQQFDNSTKFFFSVCWQRNAFVVCNKHADGDFTGEEDGDTFRMVRILRIC